MIEKIAIRLLAIKSRTTEELRKKLTLRGFPGVEIEAVIQKFTSQGYLSDEEIVARRFQAYLEKGYGPRYIALKLKQQGLRMPPYPAALQKQVALKLLRKASFQSKDAQKRGAALQRRGFDLDVICQVCVKG